MLSGLVLSGLVLCTDLPIGVVIGLESRGYAWLCLVVLCNCWLAGSIKKEAMDL